MPNAITARQREYFAEHSHDEWSAYVLYLLSKLSEQPDGSYLIPTGYAAALRRQATTPYPYLTDDEQALDREQADKLIELLERLKLV